MLTPDGPKLLEFNVRFGDPESQVVLPRLDSDFADLLAAAADGDLGGRQPSFTDRRAVCVVGATPGYPESPRAGALIGSLHAVDGMDDVLVFCAGVARDGEGRLIASGGRVLNVVGFGATLDSARVRAYEGVQRVAFPGMHYRTDIAATAAKEEIT
jgi:phosphoribosylamine--glycine ligase